MFYLLVSCLIEKFEATIPTWSLCSLPGSAKPGASVFKGRIPMVVVRGVGGGNQVFQPHWHFPMSWMDSVHWTLLTVCLRLFNETCCHQVCQIPLIPEIFSLWDRSKVGRFLPWYKIAQANWGWGSLQRALLPIKDRGVQKNGPVTKNRRHLKMKIFGLWHGISM